MDARAAVRTGRRVPAAIRAVLADVAKLEVPTIATAAAGVLAPAIAAVFGAPVTAAEVGPELVLVGVLAASVQKLTAAKPAPPKK